MKLTRILKSFTKAQADLNKFITENGQQIQKDQAALNAKYDEQSKDQRVRDNIGKLLGDTK